MKTTSIIFVTLIIILTTITLAFAQPGLPNSPEQTPIDGGLGILAAAGGAYALKKINEMKDA